MLVDHLLSIFKEFKKLEKHLYRNELDKSCFSHDAAYSDSKDIVKKTFSDKILKNIAWEVARNCNYNGYQRALASIVYTFFDKKTGSGMNINEPQAEELHTSMIKKFKRRKVYARFKDNIWAADLAEMGSLSSKNKNVKYLLCVICVFIKYEKKRKQFFKCFYQNDKWI